MTDFQNNFCKIKYRRKTKVSFEDLSNIMYAMAQTVPLKT